MFWGILFSGEICYNNKISLRCDLILIGREDPMDRFELLRTELTRRCPGLELREEEPMARHTSFASAARPD